MFAFPLLVSVLFVAGYVAYKLRNSTVTVTETVTKTVSDPTKVHQNHIDHIMHLFNTHDYDKVINFITYVVSHAVAAKQQDENEKVSPKKLVEHAVDFYLANRKFRKFNEFIVTEAGKKLSLVNLIAKNCLTKNPLNEVQIEEIELKDFQANNVLANALHSYSSMNLDFHAIMRRQSRSKKIKLEIKIKNFLSQFSVDNRQLTKDDLDGHFDHTEIKKAWSFIFDNKENLEKQYNITITKRKVDHSRSLGFREKMMQEFNSQHNSGKPLNKISQTIIEIGTKKVVFICTTGIGEDGKMTNAFMAITPSQMNHLKDTDVIVYASEAHEKKVVMFYGEFMQLVARDGIKADERNRSRYCLYFSRKGNFKIQQCDYKGAFFNRNLDLANPVLQPDLFELDVPNSIEDDVREIVGKLPESFELSDVYQFADQLQEKYPNNKNIKAKMRQKLQVLEKDQVIEFLGKGKYKKISK